MGAYLRLYRVKDWLHFLPLPLAGWLAAPDHPGVVALVGGILGWAFALAYTSAINQAFDDRLDRAAKNPVGPTFARRQAVLLSLPPLVASLAVLAALSPAGWPAGLTMAAAATIYSAPPRLKRFPVVGTLWNVVMGVPGFFFAGQPRVEQLPLRPLVGLFALLLLISQLIHEAQDRDDDAAGKVRTVATEAGRRAALGAALIFVLLLPGAAWWLAEGADRRPAMAAACALFTLAWAALLWRHQRSDDIHVLQRLRLRYRYAAIALGSLLFGLTVL